MGIIARSFLLIVAITGCGGATPPPPPVVHAPKVAEAKLTSAHERYELAGHGAALVAVKRTGEQGEYWWGCSGSLVVSPTSASKTPEIVTANHCMDVRMKDSPIVCAFFPPGEPSRQIMPEDIADLATNEQNLCTLKLQRSRLDLAILLPKKLSPLTKPVTVAMEDANVGDVVFGVLAPRQLVNTYFEGYVNSRLSFVDIDWDEDFQSDALFGFTSPVTGGASGGMVLDAKGELVGITIAVVNGTNTGIALRISAFRDLL